MSATFTEIVSQLFGILGLWVFTGALIVVTIEYALIGALKLMDLWYGYRRRKGFEP